MFENYPTITYNLKDLSNILLRYDAINVFTDQQFIENYYIKDEDTPESLALDRYDSSIFSWIILLIGQKFNKETDWPLNSNKLNDYFTKKYNYSSIFLLENIIDFSFSKVKKIRYGLKTYDVSSYDRTLNKINLATKLPTSLSTTDTVTLLDSNNSTIKQLNISKIVYEAKDALHHFEQNGEVKNPRDYLTGYINGSSLTYVVTNIENEEKLNDEKRDLKILKSDYIVPFTNQINNILIEVEKRKDIENV